jgi:uncharacterized protein YdhG (YjbR/CyaY superfamily)
MIASFSHSIAKGANGGRTRRFRRLNRLRDNLVQITLMKKASSSHRGSASKSNAAPRNVDEYLAGVPEPARSTLNKIRAAIRSAVPPEATEVISYRIPMFKYKGMVMGFAAFSNHCSLFPGSLSALKGLKKELKEFQTAKGTIRFPVDKPPSAALVKKLVKARIAENERKKQR